MVKEYLKFNRVNLNDYRGYTVYPRRDYIIVYLPYKRYKINIRDLENFYYTMKGLLCSLNVTRTERKLSHTLIS